MKALKFIIPICLFSLISCKDNVKQEHKPIAQKVTLENTPKKPAFKPSKDFYDYWYGGKAEISSYKLEQARYGEMREGSAVLVFVTEDFLPDEQVKADNYSNRTLKSITNVSPKTIKKLEKMASDTRFTEKFGIHINSY